MKIDCPNCFYPNDANAKCCDKCGEQIAWKEESYIGAGRSLKVLENISAAGSVIIRKKVTKAVEAIKKRNE